MLQQLLYIQRSSLKKLLLSPLPKVNYSNIVEIAGMHFSLKDEHHDVEKKLLENVTA